MSDLFDSVAADVLTTPEHAPFGGTILTASALAEALRARLNGAAFWQTVKRYATHCAMEAVSARTCATCKHCETVVGDRGEDEGCQAGIGRPFHWRDTESYQKGIQTFQCSLWEAK